MLAITIMEFMIKKFSMFWCPEAIKEINDFTELMQNSILTEIDLMSEFI